MSIINNVDFLKNKPGRYCLEARGDSMKDIGILDGDFVVIQHQNTANNGDIVVAVIDNDEATLKRYRKMPSGNVILIPENSAMQPVVYEPGRVEVQGKCIGVFRQYGGES